MIDRRYPCLALMFAAGLIGAAPAQETAFVSRSEAMKWLATEVPRATTANPSYLTKSDGTVSRWLTKVIRFTQGADGRLSVSMDESYTQSKAGVSTPGRHRATFLLKDVEISEFTEPGDVTPAGEPSHGILFRCKVAECVAAVWSGQAARSEKTDISIQDNVVRAKILAAFRYLQTPKS